jgi:hypothetical protein
VAFDGSGDTMGSAHRKAAPALGAPYRWWSCSASAEGITSSDSFNAIVRKSERGPDFDVWFHPMANPQP